MEGYPREKTRWLCSDGRDFDSRETADKHESHLRRVANANAILSSGGCVADALRASGYKGQINPVFQTLKAGEKRRCGNGRQLAVMSISTWMRLGCHRIDQSGVPINIMLTVNDVADLLLDSQA